MEAKCLKIVEVYAASNVAVLHALSLAVGTGNFVWLHDFGFNPDAPTMLNRKPLSILNRKTAWLRFVAQYVLCLIVCIFSKYRLFSTSNLNSSYPARLTIHLESFSYFRATDR